MLIVVEAIILYNFVTMLFILFQQIIVRDVIEFCDLQCMYLNIIVASNDVPRYKNLYHEECFNESFYI